MSRASMNRRAWLGVVSAIPVGCAAAPRYLSQPAPSPALVPIDRFGESDRLVVIRHHGDYPVLLSRDDGEFTALELRCTHRGCALRVRRDDLECPCHGSRFTFGGEVLDGPAAQPLAEVMVTRRGDQLELEQPRRHA